MPFINNKYSTIADMSFPVDSYQCDYLDRNQHILPQTFVSERAELAHINGQISSLEGHISQLAALRQSLLLRSQQLHNSLSPIYNIPIEVLSYIFKQLVDVPSDSSLDFCDQYDMCLRQAFILGSVSTHFRQVALGTSELWRRICLPIPDIEAIGEASSLLQHCLALAPSLDISLTKAPSEEEAQLAFDALLTPDTTQKIKSFELHESFYPSTLWIDKFKACSPILDTLSIRLDSSEPLSFHIQTLTTVTRLKICNQHSFEDYSIIVPPYVQYLEIGDIEGYMLVSILYQCSNLIECTVELEDPDPDVLFTEPLTLPHLKRLSSYSDCSGNHVLMSTSVENLQLPSLESLQLGGFQRGAILLCRGAAATLTTLTIWMSSDESQYDNLSQLHWITFPKLKWLDIWSDSCEPLIQALELLEGDCRSTEPHRFPALQSINLSLRKVKGPRSLLNLLQGSKIGEAFHINIQLGRRWQKDQPEEWSPELLKELRSIVGSRRIEVTWAGNKIHELGRLGE